MGQFNWALGFFYLNRYLALLGHVPIMLEFFWSTSNPNKTEVSILSPSRRGGKTLMCNLPDVSIHPSLAVQNATLKFAYLSSCHHLQSFHQYLAIAIQMIVACMLVFF